MRAGLRARIALLAAVLAPGCGEPPRATWTELSRLEVGGGPPVGEAGRGARVELEGERLWLVARLEGSAWKPLAEGGRFRASLPILAVGATRAEGPAYRLVAPGRSFAYEPDPALLGKERGRFTTNAAEYLALELALEPGEEPPEHAELWAVLDFQRRASGELRVGGRRISGSGLWVPAGRPRSFALALPPEGRLTFATTVEPLFGDKEVRTQPQTFRVRLDGVALFERRVEVDVLGEAFEWHAVDLPRGGVRRARLELEVEGPLALTAFLAPCVGPRDAGRYGARPADVAQEGRPDLLVFLADTFRADNLAAYGSTLGLTPAIDAFARESRTFTRAWSTSTHTLPAHSSMFSGVYPHQNGQVDYFNPLPEEVDTLAERLARHGYRCGLVSDGVMVSSSHGLEQGFGSFDERRESGTLERVRAFLDADDGRPIFLFVQTYATHTPYTVSPETRARLGGVLRLERSYEEVMESELMRASEVELLPLGGEIPPADPAQRELVQRLHDLYRAGVADLDELFGRFLAEVEQRGLLERGCLLFASDHGESFFEHGRPFHANRVYEPELRVPLILRAPGASPGREERPVSLIDVAPTLAALAGLTAAGHWGGRSLLAPQAGRVVYAFQARAGRAGSTLAVIDGTRKLVGYEDLESVRAGKLHAAFDLAADPGERYSVLASEAWPAELGRAQRATLEGLLTPLFEPEVVELPGEELEELRKMGYAR